MSDLFDFQEESNYIPQKLNVVKAEFIEAENKDCQELFEGFDELYVITYSNGINFTCNLLSKFNHAEIILGCENTVDSDMATLLASQITSLNLTLKNKSLKQLAQRVYENELSFFVSRDIKSHEKIFILKSQSGNTRVICGSANMSYSAFEGIQRENIVYFDDKKAFDFYMNHFESFRDKCSDNMTETVSARLLSKNENPIEVEEIPICRTVQTKSIVVIPNEPEQFTGEETYITNVNQLAKELRPVIPKFNEKQGTIITGETVKTIKRKYSAFKQEKENKQKIRPILHLDFENKTVSLNDIYLNLTPSKDSVVNDIRNIYQYFKGLEIFIGTPKEILQTQKDFFKFLNWFFASVFCPKLRFIASQNEYDINKFPVYGILYGASNGGKSTFIEFLTKLMTNKKDSTCTSSDFTKTNIESLKQLGEGVPINIDDLAKEQYNTHYEGIIKNDRYGLTDEKINYPAVTITANKIPALKPDIVKRSVACRIDTRIDRSEASKNHKLIRDCIKNSTNNLFLEYLNRMFPKIDELEEKMKTSNEQFTPDLFEISSKVLLEIISEFTNEPYPDYFSLLTWEDYLGEKATSKYASNKIIDSWNHNKKMFRIDKSKNELIFTMPESSNYYELQHIADELPAVLNVRQIQYSLVMNLDAAKEHFGIDFRKGLFS